MTHSDSGADPSTALLFARAAVEPLLCPAGGRSRYACGRHLLAAFSGGRGAYRLGDAEWPIVPGLCVLLPPGCELELLGGSADLHGYAVSFDAFAWGDAAPLAAVDRGWPYHRPVVFANASRFLEPIRGLRRPDAEEGAAAAMRRSIWMQELICALLEEYEASVEQAEAGEEHGVRLTIRYMHEHYRENVTVDRLARMAGMERRKYSAAFQAEMGQKPLEYLNLLRIDEARKLLGDVGRPLREIARLVGFNDEYYFNKRFTKSVGVPPGTYVRLSRGDNEETRPAHASAQASGSRRIVVTGYALGELLALGLKPIGAEMTIIGSQVVYRDLLRGVKDVGWQGDPERIAPLHPDLIVLDCRLNRHYDRLNGIAPTAVLDNSLSSEQRLLSVAELTGRRPDALEWIASHEQRRRDVWKNLSGSLRLGESATVLLVHWGRVYLMGMSGFAVTLYHPRAFRPSASVSELIACGEPYRELDGEALPKVDGDRVFLLADAREIGNGNVRKLMDSPAWRGMDAVKEGRVHVADSSWNYDDPITRDRLLAALPGIMRVHSKRRESRISDWNLVGLSE